MEVKKSVVNDLIFFFKQKTAYEMRISDWSSDVCSSDLKRLCHARPRCGLPIGNLSSQFFSNIYLDALDQFVKHTLKAKRYLRYVDDFVLFHHDREQLVRWQQQIGRASCRERVCKYVKFSVVSVQFKKKTNK